MMRPEPLEKHDETEEIFSVSDWTVAGVLTSELKKEFPKYDYVRREGSFSDQVSIRVYNGLDEKEFHILAGFVFGYYSAIHHLFPDVKCTRIEAK